MSCLHNHVAGYAIQVSSNLNLKKNQNQKRCKQWFYDVRRWCWSLCLRPGYILQWDAVDKKGVCRGSCLVQVPLLAGRGQEARQMVNTHSAEACYQKRS